MPRGGGSSPLARGLLAAGAHRHGRVRIIPARAGFTTTRRPTPGPRWDHPRSRGVYALNQSWHGSGGGSSPLARGLRYSSWASAKSLRIIPARAGFTAWSGTTAPGPPDHPRSRGVYSSRTRGLVGVPGSSPLARGLPAHRRGPHHPRRIIPARAGFTSGVCPRRPPRSDHPRSRGVYRSLVYSSSCVTGSSPLARGLPGAAPAEEVQEGIIPARAGFTAPGPWRPGRRRDHPRSRGVYPRASLSCWPIAGSSPLARGLRDLVH